ncbi:phosphatidylinositol 3-kinase [Saccharata proteae CBS 121410]|uniref:Phosphatidylinositol 3-kinase VPS34 n=1 Tax=Saccharata proteae CBS 121410 TaxID=1314787 RepID=A0A9P4HRC7_9PEZI|nr:phosphatidylinositol 3-kinase [Saccharata proteae CBS 121410]
MEPFSFASSADLNIPVHVRINNLDGYQKPVPFSTLLRRPDLRHRGSNLGPNSELYVTVQLWADSKPLTVAVQTSYKSFKNSRTWNEWLTLPAVYSTIPQSSQLAVTVWDLSPTDDAASNFHAIPFGGTTIPIFDKDNTLQKGRQRCKLYRHRAADGMSQSTTPHVIPPPRRRQRNGNSGATDVAEDYVAEMERLTALMKKHEMGEIPDDKWLDQMVWRQMEKLERNATRRQPRNGQTYDVSSIRDGEIEGDSADPDSKDPIDEEEKFFLHIDFPRFDHPIVFTDHEYRAPPITTARTDASSVAHKPPPELTFGPGINTEGNGYGDSISGRMIRIYDPEIGIRENPAESKHRKLVRGSRGGVMDRDLKPNRKIRDELNVILSYGPTHELSTEEKDLIWKFRHHLSRDKRALTKLVKSVAWNDQNEVRQAVQLLPKWTEIDVDDALELLGPTFDNPAVRAYAVERLRKADDEELLLYLLQLVQALKFEPSVEVEAGSDDGSAKDSSLARFLIFRAANNLKLGNYFHWYLIVEHSDNSSDQRQEHRNLFGRVEFDFMRTLEEMPGGPAKRATLRRQSELIAVLTRMAQDIREFPATRPHKIEKLKRFLADPKNDLVQIEPPLPLPLDPTVEVIGCYPEECNVFKSTLMPLLITFKTAQGTKYPLIFKDGDDLRQDQLVIQIITLMDRLLRKENLDLRLSPYRILATSTKVGAVQFVPSISLGAAHTKYKGQGNVILAYLRANNPDENAPLGIRKETMDTYVRSCAGYCVITYLLGVGDRHSDNLLLAPDGHFFHADFGYILGHDPKPFAPLMKLDTDMVLGMGGIQSANFTAFKNYCFTAYTTLRKSSSLILNLFSLMREANIPHIKIQRDAAVVKVQERMCLGVNEEQAIRHLEVVIDQSINAIMPRIIDQLHGVVQNWRA